MSVTAPSVADRTAALTRHLALAAEWGLEDVPYRVTPPVAPPTEDESDFLTLPAAQDLEFNLEPFSDLLAHTSTSPAGVLGLPLRMLRSFFKFVMGPWLDLQTVHNQAVLKTLLHDQASSRAYLEQLAAHVRHQQSLLFDQQAAWQGRLDQCENGLDTLRQAQRLATRHALQSLERSAGPAAFATTAGDGVSARAIQQVFLQAWLPRPPAAVLVRGGEDGDGLHLAALGYQVVIDNGGEGKPEATATHAAAFDAVVCLSQPGTARELFAAVRGMLRSGGRAVVGVTFDDALKQPPLPNGFRLLETAYAVHGNRDWTYTSDPAVFESLCGRESMAGVLLLTAEKT